MNAHLTEEQLNRFADGSLEPEERPAVARHLADCAACREEVAGIRDLVAAAGRLPKVVEPERDLWPEIRRAGAAARPSADPPIRRYWALAAAAAVVLVVAPQFVSFNPSGAWRVASLAGTPRIGTLVVTGSADLRVGDWLETDPVSRARIAVGRIGEVEVRPRTRVQLLDARPASHRIALARGTIHARVDAPPRLFIVETPAGTAVDLGCAYTLEMDSLGTGRIHVTGGWVEFVRRERRSVVPLGFVALTRPDVGPGVPAAVDAPDSLRRALFAFDFDDAGPAAVRDALRAARAEDAVSVWHLLARVNGSLRAEVYDRLSALVPPPEGVTREAVLALEPGALERYWTLIRRIAWRREILKGVRELDPRTGRTRTPASGSP